MENWLTLDGLLSWVLVLIMFAIGATLRFSDFRRIFWRPTSIAIGLLLQMLFLPIFTFCVVSLIDIDPMFKVGFIIVSLCPGGTTSNFVSYLINADVALSISLTTINSFLILLTIPIGTNLALSYFLGSTSSVHLPFGDTVSSVFLIILLPAFVGLLVNHYFPRLSISMRNPMKIVNALLLGSVYALKFFSSKEQGGAGLVFEDIQTILPAALFIQIFSMLIAYALATTVVSRKTSSVTIGIEVGLQNTALALLISSDFLANTAMSKPALIYAMFSFFTTLAFAWLIYRFVILENRRKYK